MIWLIFCKAMDWQQKKGTGLYEMGLHLSNMFSWCTWWADRLVFSVLRNFHIPVILKIVGKCWIFCQVLVWNITYLYLLLLFLCFSWLPLNGHFHFFSVTDFSFWALPIYPNSNYIEIKLWPSAVFEVQKLPFLDKDKYVTTL